MKNIKSKKLSLSEMYEMGEEVSDEEDDIPEEGEGDSDEDGEDGEAGEDEDEDEDSEGYDDEDVEMDSASEGEEDDNRETIERLKDDLFADDEEPEKGLSTVFSPFIYIQRFSRSLHLREAYGVPPRRDRCSRI